MKVKCPYCGNLNSNDAKYCSGCKEEFPWVSKIEGLENQLKERETNRVRATSVLIEDGLKSIKENKPLPLSSIKGFIYSWLVRRSVIVVGSILGSFLLIIQTYILFQQKEQIDRQNKLFEKQISLEAFATSKDFRKTLTSKIETILGQQTLPKANMEYIRNLAKIDKELVGNALEPLLSDKSSVVSGAALFILKDLDDFNDHLVAANLVNLNLENHNLQYSSVGYSKFSNSKIANSFLNGSDFYNCDFDGVDFEGSEISKASFILCNLSCANLNFAVYNDVNSMFGVNLNEVTNMPRELEEKALKQGAVRMSSKDYELFRSFIIKSSSDNLWRSKQLPITEPMTSYVKEREDASFGAFLDWFDHNKDDLRKSPFYHQLEVLTGVR